MSIIVWLAIVLLVGAGMVITFYTDFLFFKDVGYGGVFVKTFVARLLTGLAFGLGTLVFLLINVFLAGRVEFLRHGQDIINLDRLGVPLPSANPEKIVKILAIIGAILISLFTGIWASSIWKEVLVFANSVNAGLADPMFGRDISFYLFRLPFISTLQGFVGFLFFISLLLVGASYFFRGAAVPLGNTFVVDPRAKKHVSILAGLLILNIAIGFSLDRFELLVAPHQVIFGAGYTDVSARLVALWVVAIAAAISAFVFVIGLWRGSLKLWAGPLVITAGLYIIGLFIYPALLQSLRVSPNELELEKPYIEHNIAFTRFAYDLNRIEVRPFDPNYALSAADIARNGPTINNIRLWDDAPLLKTYSQLQQIRTYYKFIDVDNDRYTINNEYRQVMLSPRELSYGDLPSRSWINEKMVFTHGNGIAMGPVNRITKEGLPEFIIKDIPPVSTADLKITRPEIYFGEISSDYVIVKTKVKEFSYPTTDGNVYTSYEGEKGVVLNSFARRALFAIRFKNAKLLLSSDTTKDSRILYNREIRTRVNEIAPFLSYDSDPYIVVSEKGKLFWMLDAYTTSDRVPYSKPLSRNINYIRNSVKVTVDAYDGSVNFYMSDPNDVIARVYGNIFPGLLKPMSAMPEDLKKHVRYPQEMFQVQATMLAVYHMTDPKVFYNKEDLWEIPSYGDNAMKPYYTIMKLPGQGKTESGKEEYILLLPYTPAKRDNLAAWLAARCDMPDYGKMVVYMFPRDRLIFGPKQVSARIDQDSYISQQLTLWGQKGSSVIRGKLLVIPIESSLLYVQPLYLVADEGGLPELRRVVVAYENNVVMEENLEAGLARLFGQRKGTQTEKEEKMTAKPEEGMSISQLAKNAARIFEQAVEAQRKGDWAGYGDYLKKLGEALKKLAK
jgi:uncharacterized membrane protein (UPF0182 family)